MTRQPRLCNESLLRSWTGLAAGRSPLGSIGTACRAPPSDGLSRTAIGLADGWQASTVRAILDNPRYTGFAFFGRWTKNEELFDPDDVAAGHVTRFRRADPAKIVRSGRPAHPACVGSRVHRGADGAPDSSSGRAGGSAQARTRAQVDIAVLRLARSGAMRLLHAADGGGTAREPRLLPVRGPQHRARGAGTGYAPEERVPAGERRRRPHQRVDWESVRPGAPRGHGPPVALRRCQQPGQRPRCRRSQDGCRRGAAAAAAAVGNRGRSRPGGTGGAHQTAHRRSWKPHGPNNGTHHLHKRWVAQTSRR